MDNEISRMPDFTVQSNIDGTFYGADQWMTGNSLLFTPQDGEEHTVSAENAHMSNTVLLTDTLDGASGPDHLLWTWAVTEETTINGAAAVHLRVKTSDVDKNTLMLSAVLADRAEQPFPCFDAGGIGVLDQQVIREKGVDRGEGAEPYDLVAWKQAERDWKIIAYGSMDLRNPEAGYFPETAEKRTEAIRGDTWYDYTLYLQPTFYTVSPGHRLELYILPFCGFSDDAATFDSYSTAELEEMGLPPQTLVPFTRDYSFTVDNESSFAEIPCIPREVAP